MTHVVDSQEFKGDRRAVADAARILPAGTRNCFYETEKMEVIRDPEPNKFVPREAGVVLNGNPFLLGVAGHGKLALDLRANKPVVIIGGRIQQMAEDLFAGPVIGASGGAGVGVGNTRQLGGYASEDPPKFFYGGFKRLHNQLYRSWGGGPNAYGKLSTS